MNKVYGFSLIELLVVIAILGVLLAIVVPQYIGEADKAKITSAKTEMATISNALDRYKLDNHRYPTTDQGLEALVTEPAIEPIPKNWTPSGYLKSFPTDPWGNEYLYISPGSDNRAYDLYSFGQDGKEGGEGYNEDIISW